MEGLEMGLERTQGTTDSQGKAPWSAGLVMLMAPSSRGMFCCRNGSAALFLPQLC